MMHSRGRSLPAGIVPAGVLPAVLLSAALAGSAQAVPAPRISAGVLAGGLMPDAHLADYQWDAGPRFSWGAQALLGWDRFATGLRFTQAGTTQTIGLPDPSSAAHVTGTTWELLGRGRIATFGGNQVNAVATCGRIRLGYDPDQVTIDVAGAPVVVDLAPVNEWIAGVGLAVERPVMRALTAGVEVDHRRFRMTTAHRSGDEIVVGRESFHEWSARVSLAWSLR